MVFDDKLDPIALEHTRLFSTFQT